MGAKTRLTRTHQCAIGGIAELTFAVDSQGVRRVIRELLPRYVLNWRMHRRFIRGTKIREILTGHPHIVGSVERGYQGLRPYEIIECVPGKNVSQLVLGRSDYLRRHLYQILRQSAAGLAYMHEQGILHLDVKAQHFLMDPTSDDVHVKLTDFDLCCRANDTHRDRTRAGTFKYMAPEQVRKGAVGVEADIFAFGIYAYYLVTWRMPFTGSTEHERRKQQLSMRQQIKAPRRINPDITPKLERLIMGCLAKDVTKRFPSMSYFLQELESGGIT